MTDTLNLQPEELDSILTILEPVVLQGYGAYFKPKYEGITPETWEKGMTALQKELEVLPVEGQEGTVYVAAEKSPQNDIKSLLIATALLKYQTDLLGQQIQQSSAPQQTVNQAIDTTSAGVQSGLTEMDVFGSEENKAGWMKALHTQYEVVPLNDDGKTILALRPREQKITSFHYMKAYNDLAMLVPCRPVMVDGQRFILAKTPGMEEKFAVIANALHTYQHSSQPVATQAQVTPGQAAGSRVVLKGGNILNTAAVFQGPAPKIPRNSGRH